MLFVFSHFLANQPKQKNADPLPKKCSDPWRGTQERLGRRHRSELCVFVVCFCTFFGRPAKNKNKKQQVQTHGEGPRRGWTADIGLNFLFFFDTCWSKFLVFSLCVYCFQKLFFIFYCLHSTILTKACVSTIYTTPPPMATPSVYIYIYTACNLQSQK